MDHSKTQRSMTDVPRPVAQFSPNIWDNPLVSFPVDDESDYEAFEKQNCVLREKVRDMLMCSEGNTMENIKLIDTVCRLGVSYHFKDEIEDQLKEIYDNHLNDITKDLEDCDLNIVALVFHTLRTHGIMIPSDVFKRFKREDGKFDETMASDTRGMLSLYEAAQWRVRGEEILDEAIEFVTPRLEFTATRSSSWLASRIMDVLEWPYHKDMPRIRERRFMSFYEEEEEEKGTTRNHTLLEFAKLDYKLLQRLYRQELNSFSRWYSDLNISSKLPYGRNRMVEDYFWAAGTYFEPQDSHARVLLGKALVFTSFVNDTYDAYGTFEELSSFTDAIDRWEVSEDLPDYMKILCGAVFNFYSEAETELAQPNRSQAFVYAKDAFKQLAKAYFQKARWLHQGHIPSLEETIKIGIASCGYHSLLSTAAIGMGEAVDLEALQWLIPRPKPLEILEVICRIENDLVSYKFEQQRPHCASTVECYMKEYGETEEEAIKELQELVKQKRKEFNEEFMRPNHNVPRPLIQCLLDFLRTTDVIYEYGDAYTHPELMNGLITKLFLNHIDI